MVIQKSNLSESEKSALLQMLTDQLKSGAPENTDLLADLERKLERLNHKNAKLKL